MAVLDRPRRHVHRRGGAAPRRRARHAQAAVRQSRALSRRRASPASATFSALGARGQAAGGRDRGGQDGHDGRDQRAPRAQGRAHACWSSPRASPTRSASAIRTGPSCSRATSSCRSSSTSAWSRWTSGSRPRARCCARPIPAASAPISPPPSPPASARSRSCCCTAIAIRAHERLVAEIARDVGLHPDLGEPPRQPADEAGEPRRHHRGRCLSFADPRPLCRRDRGGARGRAPPLHAVEWRPRRCAALPGQGRDPVGPGGRHRRRRAHRRDGRLRQDHRLRHGRHLDRRVALRRRVRAPLRDGGGGRAAARADDVHPHRGGGRRLDLRLRRRALSRRPGIRRRRCRGRPAIAAAGRSPSPTATSCSASCSRNSFRACSGRDRRRSRSTATSSQRNSRRSPPRSPPRPATGAARSRSPRASSRSRSRTWRTRSSRSRSSAATT